MKAIRIHSFGGPEKLLEETVPDPEIFDGGVLVRVKAAGVNPVDTKIRTGEFARFVPCLPAIPGRDVSGTVERLANGVAGLAEGDAVFGMLDYDRGAYAAYTVASTREIVSKPPGISFEEAAAIPVPALTAWQALFEHGRVAPGQRVLVHGGAGGVGHFAVQFAALHGAEVIATCGADDLDFVRGLGAREVFDYKAQRFEKEITGIDVVLDLVGGDTRKRSWAVLRKGGILVSTLPGPKPEGRPDVSGREVVVHYSAAQLENIALLVAEKKVKVELARIFPLAQAHRFLDEQHIRGKIALVTT